MLFQNKKSLQELRRLNVSAEMAGTMFGMIFGVVALVTCVLSEWAGNHPDAAAVKFSGTVAFVLFAIAGISIFSRIRQLDSAEKKLRLLITLILGFVVLALDALSMVYVETKLDGFPGWIEWTVFSLHALVGVGCLGMFTMARAFAK